MAKCKNCYCDCHCDSAMHVPKDELDKGGACTCEKCTCENKRTYKTRKEWANDMSYENNGGLVIDDTDECESCQ